MLQSISNRSAKDTKEIILQKYFTNLVLFIFKQKSKIEKNQRLDLIWKPQINDIIIFKKIFQKEIGKENEENICPFKCKI